MNRSVLRIGGEIATLVGIAALSRLVPHPPNMTAVSAVALKSRARFGPIGIAIPLVAMALSDLVIGLYDWKLLVSVYASFALVGMLGMFLAHASALWITFISALGSTLFFLITNTVVWASSLWYPCTASGLIACLVAGLPFYYSMLAGDVIFSLLLCRGVVQYPACRTKISARHALTLSRS